MSRWLLHYSPAAVLVRLCSLSILLSYGCTQVFRFTGALIPKLENLSRCLPLWVMTCICLLISYFSTQQDMSIEQDRDHRRRRLVLRLKCLYTIAGSSLLSLLALIIVIHIGPRQVHEIWQELCGVAAAYVEQSVTMVSWVVAKQEL